MATPKTGPQGADTNTSDIANEGRSTDAHVGQRLRQRRWMLGLTQQQVGDRVGIKFQQVQKYETGQNRVSASRLWDLATALDVPVGYFYDGLGGAPSEETSPTEDAAGDPMADRESIELIRAYYAIPEEPRRRLFDLAKAMSEAATGGGAAGARRSFSAASEGETAGKGVAVAPGRTFRLRAG